MADVVGGVVNGRRMGETYAEKDENSEYGGKQRRQGDGKALRLQGLNVRPPGNGSWGIHG